MEYYYYQNNNNSGKKKKKKSNLLSTCLSREDERDERDVMFKVFWSSWNDSFFFSKQIIIYNILICIDYKSEKNMWGTSLIHLYI